MRECDDEGPDYSAAQAVEAANEGGRQTSKADAGAFRAEKSAAAIEYTGEGGSEGRDHPGEREHEIDVDAALAGEQRIFRGAAKLHAEPGEAKEQIETDEEGDRQEHARNVHVGERRAAREPDRGRDADVDRHPRRAPDDNDGRLEHDGESDRDENGDIEGFAYQPAHHRHVDCAAHDDGEYDRSEDRQHERIVLDHQARAVEDEAADDRELAMGEIHHAARLVKDDDPCREQRIGTGQDQNSRGKFHSARLS